MKCHCPFIQGRSIANQAEGNGSPIVLLHGWLSASAQKMVIGASIGTFL